MNSRRRSWPRLAFWSALSIVIGMLVARPTWRWLCGNSNITIYGRVVDEAGNPISGAKQDVQILYSPFIQLPIMYGRVERIRQFSVYTNSDGRFVIEGESGYSVSLTSLTKNGHTLHDLGPPPYISSWTADHVASWSSMPDRPEKEAIFRVSDVPPWRTKVKR